MRNLYLSALILAMALSPLSSTQRALAQSAVDFDIDRAALSDPAFLPPFAVSETVSLRGALEGGAVSGDTRLLVVDFAGHRIALNTRSMAWNHVAQGELEGRPWLATFCVVCNSGAGFVPVVDGRTLHFEAAGVYDGVIVLRDRETRSIWNHMSGTAVYGALVGRQLDPFTLRHNDVTHALAEYGDLEYAFKDNSASSSNPFYALSDEFVDSSDPRNATPPALHPSFVRSLAVEDTRLDRMDLGLGVRIGGTARYYSRQRLRSLGGLLFDAIEGQPILVYEEPGTGVVRAISTDVHRGAWEGTNIRLGNRLLTDGKLVGADGTPTRPTQPFQIFTRWYGFALSFPGCEIHGGADSARLAAGR
jgi:Protein of unknown function (DUF3179)